MSQVSVIPDVSGNFLVIDYSRPANSRVYRRPVRIIKPELTTFNIPVGDVGLRYGLKQALRELIEINVEVGIMEDINKITGEYEHSPPIKIHPSERNRLRVILGGNKAVFQIVRVNGRGMGGGFGQERVFKSAPPELYFDSTIYFEPDRKSLLFMPSGEEATCSYQYIYQTFGKVNGFKKLAGDYNKIQRWSRTEPPQYQTWLRHYARERNIEVLDYNIQTAVDKEVKSFETELYKVNITDIGEEERWSEEEIEKSMNVLDIIRWCMWAKINCYVVDYDGHYYMSYNHKQLAGQHPDVKTQKNRRSIVVKVRDNHAYFVKDADLKKSACARYETWRAEDFDEITQVDSKYDEEFQLIQDSKEVNNQEYWIHPYHTAKHQAEKDGIITRMAELDIDPLEIGWDRAFAKLGETNPYPHSRGCYKNNPPPTPQEILDDSGKTFYYGTDKLNGLISHLYHNYNKLPSDWKGGSMNGSTGHKIDRATYGNNKIMSRNTLPMYSDNLPHKDFIDSVKELLPDLDYSRLPTIKAVADEIFKKLKLDQSFWSMFNSNTRRAFFDNEIKPDNQVYKAEVETDYVWSVDISKAYTTAIKDYDLEWNVFDAVCDFEKYQGDFNPSYFYLVKEIGEGFPLKNQKEGLVLYHGCLLRHLLDKSLVEIKYFIKPIKRIHSSYFAPFVEECRNIARASDENISYKRLINTWVGGLKKPDKVNHFKFHTTPSETSITRAFYEGNIVSLLDKNTEFNEEYRFNEQPPLFLISKPSHEFNIQSGQPIRLAIIEKCNEMLYKLDCEMRSALRSPLKLCLTKTDALYYEALPPLVDDDLNYKPFDYSEFIQSVGERLDFDIRKENSIDKDDWVFREYRLQNEVRFHNWSWKNKIPINHKWDKKTGAKLIYRLINTLGGGWIEGEGGVGKTEYIKGFTEIVRRNKIRYRFLKCYYKSNEDPRAFEKLEEWRNHNPVFIRKLAPTNKACNNIGGETLHKGLGFPVLSVDVDDTTPAYYDRMCSILAGNGYSSPSTDYCVIDEISFMDGWSWSLIAALKRRVPRMKFLLSGDIKRQLPPIGEENRLFENAYVIKELVNFNKIQFNYNFRNGTSGNILWDDWSKHPERFIPDNDAPITARNLCWTNKKRKEIIGKLEDEVKKSGIPFTILERVWDDVWGGMFDDPDEDDYYN